MMVWSINNHFTDSNRIFIMVIVKKRNDENWVLILILCMKSEKYTDTFFLELIVVRVSRSLGFCLQNVLYK